METSYEFAYVGNGKIEFINTDMDSVMSIDDKNQELELIENGTLCSRCGELNENLISDDNILKAPSGERYICAKCIGGISNE